MATVLVGMAQVVVISPLMRQVRASIPMATDGDGQVIHPVISQKAITVSTLMAMAGAGTVFSRV